MRGCVASGRSGAGRSLPLSRCASRGLSRGVSRGGDGPARRRGCVLFLRQWRSRCVGETGVRADVPVEFGCLVEFPTGCGACVSPLSRTWLLWRECSCSAGCARRFRRRVAALRRRGESAPACAMRARAAHLAHVSFRRSLGRVGSWRLLAPRLLFWVGELLLFGFELQGRAAARERFAGGGSRLGPASLHRIFRLLVHGVLPLRRWPPLDSASGASGPRGC